MEWYHKNTDDLKEYEKYEFKKTTTLSVDGVRFTPKCLKCGRDLYYINGRIICKKHKRLYYPSYGKNTGIYGVFYRLSEKSKFWREVHIWLYIIREFIFHLRLMIYYKKRKRYYTCKTCARKCRNLLWKPECIAYNFMSWHKFKDCCKYAHSEPCYHRKD